MVICGEGEALLGENGVAGDEGHTNGVNAGIMGGKWRFNGR